jgi:hypothetical protein
VQQATQKVTDVTLYDCVYVFTVQSAVDRNANEYRCPNSRHSALSDRGKALCLLDEDFSLYVFTGGKPMYIQPDTHSPAVGDRGSENTVMSSLLT